MKFTLLTALTALVSVADAAKDKRTFAVLRFTGKQLTQGRMDPIVFPGKPSGHVHTVMGGSGFSLSSTGKDLQNSKCSNAMVKGDNSNYWFPSLYFRDPKAGTFEPVEVFYVNAYYFFEPTNDDIKAFPLGMSMVSGNATTRIVPQAGGDPNLDPSKGPVNPAMWTCPRSTYDPPSYPPNSDGSLAGIGNPNNKGEGAGFPDYNCDGYASPLRADVHFPSCYNPAAGLTNFAENMAWPTDNKGKQDCPKGYIHVPHLFLEVYWNTPLFVNRWEQGKGHQPFVLASGDATGFSSHGDFMAGWDEDLLQHIIDTCDTGSGGMDTCAGLTYGLNKGECTIPSLVDEKIDGVLDKLPGNNPIEGWYYGVDGSSSGSKPAGRAGSGSAAPAPSVSSKASSDDATTKTASPQETTSSVSAESAPSQYGAESASVSTSSVPSSRQNSASVESHTAESHTVKSHTVKSHTIKSRTHEAYAVTASADAEAPTATIPNGVFVGGGKSSCKPKIHTVTETVTVTESGADAPAKTDAPSKNEPVKREQFEKHMHNHARRHGTH